MELVTQLLYYAVNRPKPAKLIRFLTMDCCAGPHKTLGARDERADRGRQGLSDAA
jgi:hypothetical protein